MLHSIEELPPLSKFIDNSKALSKLNNKEEIQFFPITAYDKDIDFNYSIVLYGNILGGTPAALILTDVMLPFYAKYKDRDSVEKILKRNRWRYKQRLFLGKPFNGYSENKKKYIEIRIPSLSIRIKAIKEIKTNNIIIYEDDISKLHRNAMARYKIEPTNWINVNNYQIITDMSNVYKKYHKGLVLVAKINSVSNYNGDITDDLKRNYRKLSWDIETKTYGKYGDPVYDRVDPKEHPEYDVIKQISMCFRWSSREDIINILLTTEEQDPSDNYHTILCTDQFELIKNFFMLFVKYRPNIDMGFNTMSFDWKMIYFRFQHMEASVKRDILTKLKFSNEPDQYRRYQDYGWGSNVEIKLGGSNKINGTTFWFTDCLHYDLLPALLQDQEYGAGEKSNYRSLNSFLDDNNLGSKKDMDYDRMHEIFDSGDKANLKIVGDYCLHDSYILHKLEEKRNMILTNFEFGNLTYTFPKDGIYCANGLKIINKIRSFCHDRGYLMRQNMWTYTESKYGAIVLVTNAGFYGYNSYDKDKYSPDLIEELESTRNGDFERTSIERTIEYIETIQDPGLKKELYAALDDIPPKPINYVWKADRGLIPEDYASLYPHVMKNFNMSPELIIEDEDEYERLSSDIKSQFRLMKFFDGKNRWILQHNNDMDKMGILPSIQRIVYNKRADIKDNIIPSLYKSITDENKEVCLFKISVLNSKQLAQKIFINSVYGLLNDKTNKYFYSPYLSQGVCNGGRFGLIVAKIVAEHYGFVIYYGDTDSVYLCAPNEYYEKLDASYEKREIDIYEYKKRMVEIELNIKFDIQTKINDYIQTRMGHKFYTINPEEILSNPLMITKKFYSALTHGRGYNESYINNVVKNKGSFEYIKEQVKKNILQKGMATKRRDKSPFQQEIMRQILVELSDPAIKKSLLEICMDKVIGLSKTDYDLSLFKMYGTYKSAKNNNKNNLFVSNMKKQYDITIRDLNKFSYYITYRPEYNIDIHGKRLDSVGNKMVYGPIVEEQKIPLDYTYYAESIINMLRSILAVYHKFTGSMDDRKAEAHKYMTNEYNKNVNTLSKRDQTSFNKKLYKQVNNIEMEKFSFSLNELVVGSDNKIQSIVSFLCSTVSNEYFDVKKGDSVIDIDERGNIEIFDESKKPNFKELLDKNIKYFKSLLEIKNESSQKKYRDILKILTISMSLAKYDYLKILNEISDNIDTISKTFSDYEKYLFKTINKYRNEQLYKLNKFKELSDILKVVDTYETPESIVEFNYKLTQLEKNIKAMTLLQSIYIYFKN